MAPDLDQQVADIVAECDAWRSRGLDAAGRYLNVTLDERVAMLKRQDRVMSQGPLEARYDHVAQFEVVYLRNALFAGMPERGLDLVQRRCPPDAVARGDVLRVDQRFQQMAVCLLAALGRDAEALALMELSCRCGQDQVWRYDLDGARDGPWDSYSGERMWLSSLAQTPEYQRILQAHLPDFSARSQVAFAPLKMVQDGVLGGKKPKRCVLTQDMIAPGADVVRFRPLHELETNTMQLASAAAFAAGPALEARAQLEGNSLPVAQVFLPRRVTWERIKTPEIALFEDDVARAPGPIDIPRAVDLIAQHRRDPIAYVWEGPGRRYTHSFREYHAADGHGEAGDLLWKLVRSGHFAAMAAEAATRPEAEADAFFALAACFDDTAVQHAAAAHFGLPDLPDIIALALSARARPKTAERLADYGAAHPRFRRALAKAMEDHALHLYSAYVPSVNWYLDGWARFSRACGSSLMFFCTDTPEDIPVLAQMIARQELLRGGGGASSAAYSDCGALFYQVALLHLARTAPGRLSDWLEAEWMTKRLSYPAEAALRKYVAAR